MCTHGRLKKKDYTFFFTLQKYFSLIRIPITFNNLGHMRMDNINLKRENHFSRRPTKTSHSIVEQ